MNEEVEKLYKPFRDHLKPVAIENAFYVIWAYINFFQFNALMPKDIQVIERVIKNRIFPPGRAVLEWELALLAREIIVNGQDDFSKTTQNFNDWNYFAATLNSLKDFENNSWPTYGDVSKVFKEVRRIAHRQFPWQHHVGTDAFIRYFKIYNNPRIASIVESKLGLTVQQWYTAGTAAFGAITTHAKFNIDPNIVIGNMTKKEFDLFFNFTSTDLDNLKKIISKEVKYDDEFVYTLNPLEYYPFVRIDKYYYCPVPNFLAWRMTSGIYFDLVGDKKFGHPFGLAFQDYLEEVSAKILDKDRVSVLPEKKYKTKDGQKDSIDLILTQENCAYFVEAKAKRMQRKSKSQLLSDEAINKDLDILADDIVQAYTTISDYQKGLYPHLSYKPVVKIYPLLVTLEDWFLFGTDAENLEKKVTDKLKDKDLPATYLTEMPYTVCSIQDFEIVVQLLNSLTITELMNNWFAPEKKGHNFGQFILTNYAGRYKSIDDFFPGDFESIYPNSLMAGHSKTRKQQSSS